MGKVLVISVVFADESDFDFARHRLVGVVEDQVADLEDEGRMDGEVQVGWEIEDEEEE